MSTTVSNFFDSAVIIDDELPDGYNDHPANADLSELPFELLRSFQHKEKIIVSPVPFRSPDMVDEAAALAVKAKLTILDWHLNGGKDPTSAIGILRRMVETAKGMRWVVIYTREGTEDIWSVLTERLKELWMAAGRMDLYHAVLKAVDMLDHHQDNTLVIGDVFITYMSKRKVTAQAVLERFNKTLLREFGPVSLAAFGLATEVNAQSHVVLSEFAKPFDLAVRLHLLTSEITEQETPAFLYHLYAQTLSEKALNALSMKVYQGHRLKAIKDAHAAFKADRKRHESVLQQLQSAPGLSNIRTWKWAEALAHLEESQDLPGLDERLKASNLKQFGVDGADQAKAFRTVLEILCAYADWWDNHRNAPVKDFYADLQRQTIRFTRLLKFEQNPDKTTVDTGSIYLQDGRYLLCITPYCDTARPKKVNHQFKFLVGRECSPEKAEVKEFKDSDKSHGTFIPIGDDLRYVVWDLFNVQVEFLPKVEPNPMQAWVQRGCIASELMDCSEDLSPFYNTCSPEQRLALLAIAGETGDEEFLNRLAGELELVPADGENGSDDDVAEPALPPLNPRSTLRDLLPPLPIPRRSHFVAKLKREYAQQIINKYMAYHSRAGVEELYLKEWPDQLLGVFKDMPAVAALEYELTRDWHLSDEDARSLASNQELHAYFKEVTLVTDRINAPTLMRWLTEAHAHKVPPEQIARLLETTQEGTVTPSAADLALQYMIAQPCQFDDVIAQHDLGASDDIGYVTERVTAYLAENQKPVQRFLRKPGEDIRSLLNPLLKKEPKLDPATTQRVLQEFIQRKGS